MSIASPLEFESVVRGLVEGSVVYVVYLRSLFTHGGSCLVLRWVCSSVRDMCQGSKGGRYHYFHAVLDIQG